jgi:hypothetical protein
MTWLAWMEGPRRETDRIGWRTYLLMCHLLQQFHCFEEHYLKLLFVLLRDIITRQSGGHDV